MGTVLTDKLYKNAILEDKLNKFSVKEKHFIVKELLKGRTERGLARELGVPHSTLHDWASLRQDNTEENIHVSLSTIFRKLEKFAPKSNNDLDLLRRIKLVIDNILQKGLK